MNGFETNDQLISRIKTLIRDIDRDPFKGIGKPEPLKGNWAGFWSRRIDQEHRVKCNLRATIQHFYFIRHTQDNRGSFSMPVSFEPWCLVFSLS